MNKKSLVVGICLVSLIVGFVMFARKDSPVASTGQSETKKQETGVKIKGSSSAPIQIVEFSDFQCPACMKAQPVLKEFFEKYPGKVALTFKHFPLSGHVWAGLSHQASECANRQGKFWEYHDRLFDEQKSWSGPENPLETFLRYAREMGLDLDAFGTCLSDEKVKQFILAEKQEGVELKVRSTPTLFVNDERMVGSVQLKIKGEKLIRETLGLSPIVKEDVKDKVSTTLLKHTEGI